MMKTENTNVFRDLITCLIEDSPFPLIVLGLIIGLAIWSIFYFFGFGIPLSFIFLLAFVGGFIIFVSDRQI
ncbi:MAG: hypothetical protein DRN05_04655 [Thermoplasmata archaeon]|nr:MAG: hypothetical protein DRN05_04655 [Thermoplasmata archaeon]